MKRRLGKPFCLIGGVLAAAIVLGSWLRASNPAAALLQKEIKVVQISGGDWPPPEAPRPEWCSPVPRFHACELRGEVLQKVLEAVRASPRAWYLWRLPEEKPPAYQRFFTIYVAFTDGHYRYLWRDTLTREGEFHGGGGAIVDGREAAYSTRRFFRYFTYRNPELARLVEELRRQVR